MSETSHKPAKSVDRAPREVRRRAPASPSTDALDYAAEFANPPSLGNYAIGRAVGGGFDLPEALRREFEGRFGADFSSVKLHQGPRAAAEADLLNANAFTLGSNIFFSGNQYSPFTSGGKQLIAHELAHVVQQRRGGAAPVPSVGAAHERGAEAASQAYAAHTGSIAVEGSTGAGVACDQKKRPTDKKFLADAFHANRYHAWSNKIGDWPVDPKLKELWSKLNVAASREQHKKGGFTEVDAAIARPEFVEFVELVREFQYQNFPNVDKSFDGIVNAATAAKLGAREQQREDERRVRETARRREIEVQKTAANRRVIEKISVGASSGASISKAKPSWSERALGAASDVAGTVKKAADDPLGTYNAVADKAEATLDSTVSTVKKAAADPAGTVDSIVDKAKDYVGSIPLDEVKQIFINLLVRQLPLPGSGTSLKLLTAVGEGIGEQIYQEVIREKKGEKLFEHLKKMELKDIGELQKGYMVGAVEGLVSPVTDLYGLLVFGEKMNNLMQDAMLKAIANIGHIGPEAKALLDSAGTLATSLGEFIAKVRKNPTEVILAVLNAPEALERQAIELAKRLGREGGSAIVSSLEDPWKPKKHVAAPDPLKSPLAYGEHLAKAGEDYVLDTPWAKVGSKVGYAVGFVVIQVLLLVFTSGVGNGISKAASALGEIGNALSKLGSGVAKAAGAAAARVAELVNALGKGITWIENGIVKVLEKLMKKLPSIGKVLKPIGDVMEKLKKFLQKLLGVAEKEGAALVDTAAAKTADALGDESAKLAPRPPVQPPATNPPPKSSASTAGGSVSSRSPGPNVRPIVSQNKPPVSKASEDLTSNLAKQPADKLGSVTPIKKSTVKPDPLPPVKSQKVPVQQVQEDAGKIAVGQTHGPSGAIGGGNKPAMTVVRDSDAAVASAGKSGRGSSASPGKSPQGSQSTGSPSTQSSKGGGGGSGAKGKGNAAHRPHEEGALPEPFQSGVNPRASVKQRADFVRKNRDLLGPRQRADLDALKGEPPTQKQLRAWEERITDGLKAAHADEVAGAVGAESGSVGVGKRPKTGPRSGGYEWEETHSALRGEPKNDYTYSVRTETDAAQFDSLGKPGGKVQPLENKAYDKPPDEFVPPTRLPHDTLAQMQQNNRQAVEGLDKLLANEESRLWKARQLADQMERQARISRDLNWPPVEWPMHSRAVDQYFTREVLPLVPKELRNKIRLTEEYFFD